MNEGTKKLSALLRRLVHALGRVLPRKPASAEWWNTCQPPQGWRCRTHEG